MLTISILSVQCKLVYRTGDPRKGTIIKSLIPCETGKGFFDPQLKILIYHVPVRQLASSSCAESFPYSLKIGRPSLYRRVVKKRPDRGRVTSEVCDLFSIGYGGYFGRGSLKDRLRLLGVVRPP